MTPTYTGDGWEIRACRWQDSTPDSVDVVISDPPYDARTHDGGRKGVTGKGANSGVVDKRPIGFEPIDDPAGVGSALVDISRRWVVCFCAIEQIGGYAAGVGPDRWVRGGIYVKTNPTPQFSGDRPATWGDAVAIMHRPGRKRWNGGGRAARWTHARGIQKREGALHETQKPLALMLELVSLFSEPGELVWDPYCGSGTTGVACLRLGRRFLGHELQPHYAEIAAERLAAEERGLSLRDARAGQMSILDAMGEP